MSLVSTLAKVAVGIAVAKGVSSLSRGASRKAASADTGGRGGGLADMLGGMMGGGQGGGSATGGGLADMLGGLMGGGAPTAAATGARGGAAGGGGLADMLGGMMGGGASGGSSGGANPMDALGKMLGGGGQGDQGGMSGGLGGLLDQFGGAAAAGGAAGGLGGLLNQALQQGEPEQTPTLAQEQQAALLLRAMIQAAKCDGRIDQAEKEALTKYLGDVSREEAAIVEASLNAPVDVDALVNDTPKGMEAQVYMISLLGLDLDSQAEAQYLHTLAQKLGIDPQTANAIHEKMGEPVLYG